MSLDLLVSGLTAGSTSDATGADSIISQVIAVPSHSEGDLLVLVVSAYAAQPVDWTTLSQFTQVALDPTPDGFAGLQVGWRIATSEPASYTVPLVGVTEMISYALIALQVDTTSNPSSVAAQYGHQNLTDTNPVVFTPGMLSNSVTGAVALSFFALDTVGDHNDPSGDNIFVTQTLDAIDFSALTNPLPIATVGAKWYDGNPNSSARNQTLQIIAEEDDIANGFSSHTASFERLYALIPGFDRESGNWARWILPTFTNRIPPNQGDGGGGTTSGGGGGTRQGSYEVKTAVAHGKRRRIQIAVLPHMLNDQMLRE